MSFSRYLAALLLPLAVVGCATVDSPSRATVTGEVTTPTPLTLPRGAQLDLLLVDLRNSTGVREALASRSVAAPGAFPIPFELPYRRDEIAPDGDIRLIAQITHHDAVWYSNVLRPQRVLAAGEPTEGIEVVVRKDGVLR